MKIGSLCTGYGGLEHAAEQHYNATTAWHAENASAPSRVLAHHHPDTPNHGDLNTTDWTSVEPVDIITAGYPCQPFSSAGHRKGTNDPRHLWPAIAVAISILRPRNVILENVAAHLTLGFDTVLADLTRLGYNTRWGVIRASDAGAPHQRARLYAVATNTRSDRHGGAEDSRRMGRVDGADAGAARQRQRARTEPRNRSTTPPTDPSSDGRERSGPARRRRPGPPHRDPTLADSEGDQGRQLDRNDVRPRRRTIDGPPDAGRSAPTNTDSQRRERLQHQPTPETRPATNRRHPHRRSEKDHATPPDAASERRGRRTDVERPDDTPAQRSEKVDTARRRDTAWGDYEPAIQRWETILQRPAPPPTTPGRTGHARLNPELSEWMMGLPHGYITNPDIGLTRAEQLRTIGNGVVPQAAHLALRLLDPQ